VELTFYCLIPDKGSDPLPIRVQMASGVARELAEQMMAASITAELALKKT
jgi:hypothetical protein